MTKIDIFSGFLGAGKTTLIKKLIAEAYAGEKLVLIENEFGEINIDGGFLKESGIEISEMSAGCICCSLVGDFNKALREVVEQFHPDRILIEPSGVGKLSDVIVAVERTVDECPELKLNSYVTVADASKVKVYMKNFGEFYNNQIEAAGTIILSRTQKLCCARRTPTPPSSRLRGTSWTARPSSPPSRRCRSATSCSRRCAASMSSRRPSTSMSTTIMTTSTMSMTSTTMSTSIITTTTRMMTTTSMSIITSMTTTTTSTITIITTARSATIPRASAITIITTPTTCSPPGARKRPSSTPRQRLTTSSRSSTAATTVTFCVPRAS